MRNRKDIKEAVKREGIAAVNSDEEINGILDENQQERFIIQMRDIADSYMHSWKRMFFWLSILILYINFLALVGMVPSIRNTLSQWTPRSVTIQFLVSPVWLGSLFSGSLIAVILQMLSILVIFFVVSRPIELVARRLKLIGIIALLGWLAISYTYVDNWWWGRQIVLVVSLPLFCVAADTYAGARELAVQGVEKLASLKYTHKKV
jgi:hypothetical protein